MLRRSTKFQLILFVVITLLGVSYVGAKYVGLTKYVTGDTGCRVSAEFSENGGIFTNAEVTYRGVTVGQVGSLHLIKNGVKVDLNLDSCDSPKIPSSVQATIANRSVVGEQYVDLVPAKGQEDAPPLKGNQIIPMNYPDGRPRNHVPVATQTLLTDLDQFVNSIPLDDLRATVTELRNATQGRGVDLGGLLDATDKLVRAAGDPVNFQATTDLIDEASTVLQTQLDEAQPLASWTHSLNLLSQQLKKSDPDIRHLLDAGPSDLATVRRFVQQNRTDIGVTLANLVTVGNLLVTHLDGIEEVLELYPALAAGGRTALHDRAGWLSLVLQAVPTPQDCGDPDKGQEGYNGTVRRQPENTAAIAPNVNARCTASASGPGATNVRGSAHVPGGDPISNSGGGYAYPRAVTQNVRADQQDLRVGPSLQHAIGLDNSFLGLVTDALH
jgi:phospholipid/cholesterol/gamma-HCH transport system substrate-binding protein